MNFFYLNTKCIILYSFFLFFINAVIATETHYQFKHLWVEDGLSQSTVFAIYKDQKDFMWFGTRRGLNRYDGYQFKHYMHDIKDSNSLSSNLINTIIGDVHDNLLIKTSRDINYFDRYHEKFFVIPVDELPNNFEKDRGNNIWACTDTRIIKFNSNNLTFDTLPYSIPYSGFYDLVFDKNNILWITSHDGIISLNPINGKFDFYEFKEYLKNNDDYTIECTENNQIWVCLRNGHLFYYDRKSGIFKAYDHNSSFKNLFISSFKKGSGNILYVGTDGDGLIEINTETKKWYMINHIPDDKNSLSSNTIYSIFNDNKYGILWLGSYMGGVDYSSNYSKGFKFLYHEPYNSKSIINNNIRSLFIDKDKNIWIGTRQGVSIYNIANNKILNFNENLLNKVGLTKSIITKIWQEPTGYIWICAYKGGIILYNPLKKKFTSLTDIYPRIVLPHNLGVFDILLDSKNNLWFATDNGTYLFPENKDGFIFQDIFSKKIIEDRAGRIFIGTAYYGFYYVNPGALQVNRLLLDTITGSENVNRINTIFQDSKGNIWIGTGGNGIIKYDPTNNKTLLFTDKDGLPDNHIAGIIEDQNNVIWATTYSGIARLSTNNQKFKNIYLEKGILGKEFNPNSIVITSDGIIFAGSIFGLFNFDPNRYWENPFLPNVVFTGLYINNEKVKFGHKDSPLDVSIMFTKRLNLKYHQNSIGLEFTAPEYYMGDKVKFYYKFGDNNKDWNDLSNNRFLNFVDIKPGEYKLTIKAANSDGHSNTDGTSLLICVNPPIWKTNIAYVVYSIILISLLFFIRNIVKTRLNLKYQILLEKTEKDKQAEINQARIKLFTDISHEIGTSLTLINLPLETLNKIEDDNIKKHYLNIINKNVQRLLQLVRRIINIRRIETGNLPLNAEQDNLTDFLKSICTNFNTLAKNKKIQFFQDFPLEPVITWFDKEKIEHILFNLLSNAFKFEPEGGKVCINLVKENGLIKGEQKKLVIISVNNARSEIPEDKARNIFTRFYKGNENILGSGIGLSLTKSYIDIHKGEISFTSDKEEGVTFIIKIPYGESYLEPNEKMITNKKYELKTPVYIEAEEEIDELHTDTKKEKKDKNLILYVEDNIELRKMLCEQLSIEYNFIEAIDGEEGLIKAKNFQPDLIISDLKMNNTDGLELCSAIKKDFDVSHIPIIILTAKDDIEEQIKGMEAGADAYVTKPFSIKYLNSVIQNLILSRKKLKGIYNAHTSMNTSSISFTTMDEKFLEKVYRILEDNLDNLQFGIPEFINKLGISKYMLYSKIKALTGQTPNDFIINYRLKKAAHILKNNNINDIDIYYKLGFNDVSYFRKCFKKHFGMTPNQFVRSNRFMKS